MARKKMIPCLVLLCLLLVFASGIQGEQSGGSSVSDAEQDFQGVLRQRQELRRRVQKRRFRVRGMPPPCSPEMLLPRPVSVDYTFEGCTIDGFGEIDLYYI
ncbi:hypothetical protein H6P81_019150 [Aristolochia fimbriata]|uniref:Uncharacterized protein n=1 Tax=Aristolochia fimbriata TaxID=158543 RepID=A0AAV7DSE8_ARIFI|nr:hypothetical protein H6P81_019150 [Aristolochia fimbriata]